MDYADKSFERKILLGFTTIAVMVMAIFAFIYFSGYQTIEAGDANKFNAISQKLENLHRNIEKSKMLVVQFLTSGNESLLSERQNTLAEIDQNFSDVGVVFADQPAEQKFLEEARKTEKWVRQLGEEAVELQKGGKPLEAASKFYSKERVLKSTLIEDNFHNLITANNRKINENNLIVSQQEKRFFITALILGVLLSLILTFGYWYVRRVLKGKFEYDERIEKDSEIHRTITQNLSDTKIFIFDRDLETFFSKGLAEQAETTDFVNSEKVYVDSLSENRTLIYSLCEKALAGEQGKARISEKGLTFEIKVLPLHDQKRIAYGGMILCQDVTENKKAQAEQTRLREIIEASKDFIGIINLQTRETIYINQAGRKMLGLDSNQDYGNFNVTDIFPVWAAEKIRNEALPTAVKEGLWVGESALILADGREITISQLIQAHKDDEGKVELFSTIIRDLSDQKEIIEKLKKSEQRYRSLFDQSLGFICEHDLEGNILTINPAAAKALGYTSEEIIGRNVKDFLQNSAYPYFDNYLKIFEDKETSSGNLFLLSKSGRECFWRYYSVICREDADDECKNDDKGNYIIVNALDITQSFKAALDLQRSEENLRQFVENSPAAIAMGDRELRYINASPKWLEMIGRTREEIIGFRHRDLFTKVPQHWKDLYLRAVNGESVVCAEEKVRDVYGKAMWVRWEARPWYYSNDEIGGVVIFLENLTERKKMEQELAATRDAALESARMKSEFLANMSHEIRTPMNGVIGMAELLLETNLDEEQKGFVETIYTSGNSLLTILNDILDFSKIESGKLNFETVDFNVRYVLDSVIELFSDAAEKKKLSLFSLVHSSVETDLRGDPGRLRQILINLIGNAIKFTEKGEVFVRVESVSEDEKYISLEFTIADTGIGIGEEPKRRLFNAFEQADGTITRQFGGTGLGLAISKQLVELMNGRMYVSSELGKGSAFSFTARFEKQTRMQTAPQSEVDLSNLRVLIVDDNPTSRKILTTQTSSWKMHTFDAATPHDALDILHLAAENNQPFDLAIIDLMMPGMDGFTLADRIKRNPKISSTKILMLPSYGLRGHSRQAKNIGVDGYLVKPVNRKELRNCIINIFNNSGTTYRDDLDDRELITRHTLNEKRHTRNKNSLILVAEDNLVNQKVIESQLKKLGYVADLASNGKEVLEAIARKNYKLILMDCQMPEMDGFTTTKKIRENEGSSKIRIPIVALTASAFNEDRERCFQVGMDDYISKPTNQNSLKVILERVFNHADNTSLSTEIPVASGESMSKEEFENEIKNIYQRLDSLRDDLDELTAKEFIKLFIRDTDQRLKRITDFIREKDFENLKMEIHTLKGSTANIGAQQLSEYCKKIEKEILGENLEKAENMFMTLSNNIRLLEPYLDYNLYNNPN